MEIEQVIHEVLKIDKNAYEKIIDFYYEDIYYYVLKQIGNRETTKELCQDIFFEAYRSLKRYDAKKASFKTWLYKIANYRCIDYLRSKAYKNHPGCLDEEIKLLADSSSDVLTELIQNEKTQKVNELMRFCLKARHERIMRYYFYAELSVQEISVLEKIPTKTIYTIINRSLEKLKQALGGDFNGR